MTNLIRQVMVHRYFVSRLDTMKTSINVGSHDITSPILSDCWEAQCLITVVNRQVQVLVRRIMLRFYPIWLYISYSQSIHGDRQSKHRWLLYKAVLFEKGLYEHHEGQRYSLAPSRMFSLPFFTVARWVSHYISDILLSEFVKFDIDMLLEG